MFSLLPARWPHAQWCYFSVGFHYQSAFLLKLAHDHEGSGSEVGFCDGKEYSQVGVWGGLCAHSVHIHDLYAINETHAQEGLRSLYSKIKEYTVGRFHSLVLRAQEGTRASGYDHRRLNGWGALWEWSMHRGPMLRNTCTDRYSTRSRGCKHK